MRCAKCQVRILFGAKKAGSRQYCSQKCLAEDELGRLSDLVPEAQAVAMAHKIRREPCASCGGYDGVEIFKSYFIYSLFIYTSWREKREIVCRRCGRSNQRWDFFKSLLVGWWGVPFGILATPILLIKNIIEMRKDPTVLPPSDDMMQTARLAVVNQQIVKDTVNTKPQ